LPRFPCHIGDPRVCSGIPNGGRKNRPGEMEEKTTMYATPTKICKDNDAGELPGEG